MPVDYTMYNAGILQGKAYKTLQYHLSRTLRPFGLSVPEWKLLGQLYDNEKLRVVDLVRVLSYDPPLVTTLIHSLEKKNLVSRKADKVDKRVKFIAATPLGKSLIPKIERKVRAVMRTMLKDVTKEEILVFMKVLEIIANSSRKKKQ